MELPKSTSSDQYGRTASDFSAYISKYCKFNPGILLFFELTAILGWMLPILGYLERGLGSSAKSEWYHWWTHSYPVQVEYSDSMSFNMPCYETCTEFILPGKILQGSGAASVKLKIWKGVKPGGSAPAVNMEKK